MHTEGLAKPTNRRQFLSKLAMLPTGLPAVSGVIEHKLVHKPQRHKQNHTLPCADLFSIDGIYLNAAYTHPMSKGSVEAVKSYLDTRLLNGKSDYNVRNERAICLESFAKLIHTEPDNLAWIPSTMVGENLVVAGLGLDQGKGRVVTDAYHFDGSLYMYGELAKKGLDVEVVLPKDNRIRLEDMEAAITEDTKLVAVSLVSMINGFEHDLKALCEIAHQKGALVYADIIQAAGAVPINVKDSGVDFCACSTFKWLMGDFGAGFLYVKPESLQYLNRSQYGYRQLKGMSMESHIFPFEQQAAQAFSWSAGESTAHHFEVGTLANEAIPALRYSLDLLHSIGIENIQNHRLAMIALLQKELKLHGYIPMTPDDSSAPIISFAYQLARSRLQSRIEAANINIQLYENRLRVSPSIYNSVEEIEKLIDVLASV